MQIFRIVTLFEMSLALKFNTIALLIKGKDKGSNHSSSDFDVWVISNDILKGVCSARGPKFCTTEWPLSAILDFVDNGLKLCRLGCTIWPSIWSKCKLTIDFIPCIWRSLSKIPLLLSQIETFNQIWFEPESHWPLGCCLWDPKSLIFVSKQPCKSSCSYRDHFKISKMQCANLRDLHF